MSQGELSEGQKSSRRAKGKKLAILNFQCEYGCESSGLSIFDFYEFMQEVSEELTTGITGSWKQAFIAKLLFDPAMVGSSLSLRSRMRQALIGNQL
ncbi:hypothetical protein JTE90_008873 [Oedothorax gibbosus]|uniref:Uncharacterized protein n=1 Tax=Oedothorax gibbosus TaxID=931172 RepID=A0AAV6TEG6_9ARAC|nr:hypothetical protein JTE90_008873 [Oedothorax gibbosus]